VIFIGSFFQLVLMIAVSVGNTRRDLVEAAYTLGATDQKSGATRADSGCCTEIAEIRAHGAGLGMDLRHRRRADRRVGRVSAT